MNFIGRQRAVDLTRFRGHLISWEKGVQDVEYAPALCTRVSVAPSPDER